MQYFASAIIGKKIHSFHSGYNAGDVINFFVNKDNLKIELLLINNKDLKEESYLSTNDIRSIAGPLVIINSEDDLSKEEDLIRQKEIIRKPFTLIGSKVVTQDGKYLGRVKDFTIDYDSFKTIKLYLKASLIKRIVNESFIIDSSQVINVEKNKVIVKSSVIKAKEKSPNVLQPKVT